MKRRLRRSGETVAALLLFAAAALLMCGVVAFGAEGYGVIRDNDQADAETAIQYISTKLRAGDRDNGIQASTDRIMLHEYYDEDDYVTELYIYDGMLVELFHDVTVELQDEDGMAILPAEALTVTGRSDGVEVSVTSGGETRQLIYAPRSGYEWRGAK